MEFEQPFTTSVIKSIERKNPKVNENIPLGTKFYSAVPSYIKSSLFISRSKYFDNLILIRKTKFHLIYKTEGGDRIVDVSYLPSNHWFLIVLKSFDGNEFSRTNRAYYRTIFYSYQNKKWYPISSASPEIQRMTFFQQNESVSILYLSHGILKYYDFSYDDETNSVKMVEKKTKNDVVNYLNANNGATTKFALIIKKNDEVFIKEKQFIGKNNKIQLPTNIDFSDIKYKLFYKSTDPKKNIRCMIYDSEDKLNVVIPGSYSYCSFDKDLTWVKNDEPLTIPEYSNIPFSTIPFSFYHNDILFMITQNNYVVLILIDGEYKVRVFSSLEIKDFDLTNHSVISLDNKPNGDALTREGEIIKCKINYTYFITKNPLFIIPILHLIDLSKEKISPYINEQELKIFWNGEVFQEILLLFFNFYLLNFVKEGNDITNSFEEIISSTFAKSSFYPEIKKIQSYAKNENGSNNNNSSACYNIFDLADLIKSNNLKIVLTLFLEGNVRNIYVYLMDILCGKTPSKSKNEKDKKILEKKVFHYINYEPKSLQFPVMMQVSSIYYSLIDKIKNHSGYQSFINESIYPSDINRRVLEYHKSSEIISPHKKKITFWDLRKDIDASSIPIQKSGIELTKESIMGYIQNKYPESTKFYERFL